MARLQRQTRFTDYEGFVEKFKPKKTTDDCYTPAPVYDAVADFVRRKCPRAAAQSILSGRERAIIEILDKQSTL